MFDPSHLNEEFKHIQAKRGRPLNEDATTIVTEFKQNKRPQSAAFATKKENYRRKQI